MSTDEERAAAPPPIEPLGTVATTDGTVKSGATTRGTA